MANANTHQLRSIMLNIAVMTDDFSLLKYTNTDIQPNCRYYYWYMQPNVVTYSDA